MNQFLTVNQLFWKQKKAFSEKACNSNSKEQVANFRSLKLLIKRHVKKPGIFEGSHRDDFSSLNNLHYYKNTLPCTMGVNNLPKATIKARNH